MVSFELGDEQREIRDWVHSFAEKEIRPVAHQYDEDEEFPWPVVKKAAEVGLYGVEFLQQTYGDSTGIMPALVAEELTWGCAGIALAIQGTGLPIAAIFSQGTPEQIATWIPACFGTVEKPALGAFAVTEPEAGSDQVLPGCHSKPPGAPCNSRETSSAQQGDRIREAQRTQGNQPR